MVLVDSSVWIEALRRRGDIQVKLGVEGLIEVYEAQWCSPVRIEVIGGARLEERRRLGEYFSVIPYRSTTERDWQNAAALAWRLRDHGLTVPWLDVLIAAIAIEDSVRLYTIDDHFRQISGIVPALRFYEPGHGGMFAED
jgi:hypothetical protein